MDIFLRGATFLDVGGRVEISRRGITFSDFRQPNICPETVDLSEF